MSVYLGEFIGTILLVLLGDGVCCNVSLNKSGFKGGGAVHILIGWGMAVMVPAFAHQHLTQQLQSVLLLEQGTGAQFQDRLLHSYLVVL